MAKPLGAPSWMGRAEWRVQVFCPQDKTLAQAEFTSAEHFYKMVFSAAKPHPKPKPSASGFGLERSRKGAGEGCPQLGVPSLSGLCGDEVDVGDNGNISQFLVPHFLNPPTDLWQNHSGPHRRWGAPNGACKCFVHRTKPWRRRNSLPPSILKLRGSPQDVSPVGRFCHGRRGR